MIFCVATLNHHTVVPFCSPMHTVNYFIYARKSNESEDRQVTSIEDQISETKRIAQERNLHIVDIISESKSAKNTGRPAFNDMIKRISKGEANGILCWKLNRLARNPIDGGTISMLLQQGVIQHVQTQGQGYLPTDNVLMMLLEFGMANQFVNDLSVDVKRGMMKKAERGWIPNCNPPIGYKHNPERNTENSVEIIKDPKTFSTVQQLWKLLLTGAYPMAKLKTVAESMGLRTKKGKRLAKSVYYRLFTNPVYYGSFYWRDTDNNRKLYQGKHEPMITKRQFDAAQIIMHKKCHPTSKYERQSLYLSLFQCGECGCSVTREIVDRAYCLRCKKKFSIKNRDTCITCDTPISQAEHFSFLKKIYYRCTKKRGKCTQSYLTEPQITEQINDYIDTIQINDDFYRWGLSALKHVSFHDDSYTKLQTQLKSELHKIESRMKQYTVMRADNEITPSEFQSYRAEFNQHSSELQSQLHALNTDDINWHEEFQKAFNFAISIKKTFQKGDATVKQSIVRSLGSNPTLQNKTLYFTSPNRLLLLQKCQRVYDDEKEGFEPKKSLDNTGCFDESDCSFSALCAELEKARTHYIKNNHFFQYPNSVD